jgi:hypothetical protein
MAACGLIMRRGLRARLEALLAEFGDPWYASDASKAACKALIEEAAAVGGANDRKEQGSALHAITALVDAGTTPQHLTEETERDVLAYVTGLGTAGIALVPGAIEVMVVLDAHQVAGTFDRLVTAPGYKLPLVADLKTGSSVDYSWQPWAIQLAAYSRADAIYHQGPARDGSADRRDPMPAVDQHTGLIFHLDAGTGVLNLYLLDLDAGWKAFELSMAAREWSRAKVSAEYTPGDLTPALEASVEAAETTKLRAWLQGRIDTVGAHSAAAGLDLGQSWPPDLPTLRASDAHTPAQLDAIELLLNGIERRWEIPFPPPHPGGLLAAKRIQQAFPGSTTNDNDNDKETK